MSYAIKRCISNYFINNNFIESTTENYSLYVTWYQKSEYQKFVSRVSSKWARITNLWSVIGFLAALLLSFCFVFFSFFFLELNYLQIGSTVWLSSHVACKVVWSPAFARARNQEPVIVKAHFKATNLVVSITMYGFLVGI